MPEGPRDPASAVVVVENWDKTKNKAMIGARSDMRLAEAAVCISKECRCGGAVDDVDRGGGGAKGRGGDGCSDKRFTGASKA